MCCEPVLRRSAGGPRAGRVRDYDRRSTGTRGSAMTGTVFQWPRGRPAYASVDIPRLKAALRDAVPPLLFGLRLWASVCLALYVAFWLELDNPFWAGTSAAIVCQPQLGASLRKGWFRMIGTLVGAAMSVLLTACFPQNRALFLLGLALWGAACALAATLLRNFAVLRGGAGWLYGGDHRRRPARRHRRRRCKCSLPACRHAGQRDLPRHRLRRHRLGADRSRRRPAPAGRALRRAGGRDHRQFCRHAGLGRVRTGRHAGRSARVPPADRRPRPAGRPDARGIVSDPLSLAGVAEGGGRLVRWCGWLAGGGKPPCPAAP